MKTLLFLLNILSISYLTYLATFLYLERKRIIKFLEEQDEDTNE